MAASLQLYLPHVCAHKVFLGSNCGVFLPSPVPVEVPARRGTSVRRGAAEPSRALQGPTAQPGLGHGAWSAQRDFTAPLPPPTTRIVPKVGLLHPPRAPCCIWQP